MSSPLHDKDDMHDEEKEGRFFIMHIMPIPQIMFFCLRDQFLRFLGYILKSWVHQTYSQSQGAVGNSALQGPRRLGQRALCAQHPGIVLISLKGLLF